MNRGERGGRGKIPSLDSKEKKLFLETARKTLDSLPSPFKEKMASVEVLVEDWPSAEELGSAEVAEDEGLYGLFVGRAETEKGFGEESLLPERIILFRGPLEEDFPSLHERKKEIRKTLLHEIGHYFGLSEEQIEKLGYA